MTFDLTEYANQLGADMMAAQAAGAPPASDYTLCWRCNKDYAITNPVCPQCGAANANVDQAAAYRQSQLERT